MTSIISPILHATQMATKAQESLNTATATLNGPRPMHADKPEFRIGIPEHNGPDTPDNPWFIDRIGHEHGIYRVAAGHAREAVASIDSALNYAAGSFSRDTVEAFTRAKEQAQAGVLQLTSPTTRPVDTNHVVMQFDAAGLWLGLAKSMLQLERPRIGPGPIQPPVTILPVDPPVDGPTPLYPHNPDGPVSAEPITIQLPSPDSPIQ